MVVVRSSAHAAPRAVIASPSEVIEPPGADQGFRGAHRLHKTDEFSSVFAFRRALRGRYYMLHYRPNGLDTARLGVVVAKKLAKRAKVIFSPRAISPSFSPSDRSATRRSGGKSV